MYKFKLKYPVSQVELKKPIIPALMLLSVIIIGTAGYSYLWKEQNATFIDSLYMTIITITTVGFSEIHTLDNTGRIFTIIIAILGIGSLFYVLSVFMENLVMLQLNNYRGKKKMLQKIEHLKNHIIVVGYGRVGKLASKELADSKEEFIVIEKTFDKKNVQPPENYLTISGDATEDEILIQAGIMRAKGIIVTSANPATTLFVVLSSKVLNPNLFIVARSEEESDVEKLMRAGANRVVNPYSIGGQRLAQLMINTNIIDFFNTNLGSGENNLKIENISIPAISKLNNKTLKEISFREKIGVSVLAVIRDGQPNLNPGGEFKLEENDTLVLIGTKVQLKKLGAFLFQ
ncbi:MAG: potassium channel protein [Bacteroidota bacterium]